MSLSMILLGITTWIEAMIITQHFYDLTKFTFIQNWLPKVQELLISFFNNSTIAFFVKFWWISAIIYVILYCIITQKDTIITGMVKKVIG
jgi:hypothetical protein